MTSKLFDLVKTFVRVENALVLKTLNQGTGDES